MQISSIVTNIYKRTKTNSTSYPAADMLIDINNAYNHVVGLILEADGRWQWDDNNQTDFPIATTALVASQGDYALATSHLKVLRVELKNSAGGWSQLDTYDIEDWQGQSITQLQATTGTPSCYDVIGGSVFLNPYPNYSQSASLKVYFQRGPAEFTSAEVSTGTKEPGFASLFHELIILWVSYDYKVDNEMNATGLFNKIQLKEKQLTDFYGSRDKDDQARLTMKATRNYR